MPTILLKSIKNTLDMPKISNPNIVFFRQKTQSILRRASVFLLNLWNAPVESIVDSDRSINPILFLYLIESTRLVIWKNHRYLRKNSSSFLDVMSLNNDVFCGFVDNVLRNYIANSQYLLKILEKLDPISSLTLIVALQ